MEIYRNIQKTMKRYRLGTSQLESNTFEMLSRTYDFLHFIRSRKIKPRKYKPVNPTRADGCPYVWVSNSGE